MERMASIVERNHKYCVVYYYTNSVGERKQKWETFDKRAEARKRKKEVEYKQELGTLVVPQCNYLSELLDEYVILYGKEHWALSTYQSKLGLINNYIKPMIGTVKLENFNTHYMETYYKTLLKTPAVVNPMTRKSKSEYVGTGTIREIHKLLRSCFKQAVKWELMEKNPCQLASVPKHTPEKRQIWEADKVMYAMDVCEDERLLLAFHLFFACSLRLGNSRVLLGIAWIFQWKRLKKKGRISISIRNCSGSGKMCSRNWTLRMCFMYFQERKRRTKQCLS